MTAELQYGKKDAPEFMFSSALIKEVLAMLGGHQLFVFFCFVLFFLSQLKAWGFFTLSGLKCHREVPFFNADFL